MSTEERAEAAAETTAETAPAETAPAETPRAEELQERPPVVDFERMGQRLRKTAAWLLGLALVVWVVTIPFRGVDGALLMNLIGLALGLLFVAEVVIVGGSALSGMLAAGERGDRLASSDVSLLPPQLTRRRRGPDSTDRTT